MKETKWFLGQNSKRVFSVYKADFEGSTITNQQQWLIPNKDTGWRKTNQVMDWYFVGEDDLYPCTEDEAKKYLSAS